MFYFIFKGLEATISAGSYRSARDAGRVAESRMEVATRIRLASRATRASASLSRSRKPSTRDQLAGKMLVEQIAEPKCVAFTFRCDDIAFFSFAFFAHSTMFAQHRLAYFDLYIYQMRE